MQKCKGVAEKVRGKKLKSLMYSTLFDQLLYMLMSLETAVLSELHRPNDTTIDHVVEMKPSPIKLLTQ